MAKPRAAQGTPRPARALVAKSRHVAAPALLEPKAPARAAKADPVKVRALEFGYYDHARRRVGDVFVISGKRNHEGKLVDFSKRWMELVDPSTPRRVTTAKAALEQQHDEALGHIARPGEDETPTGAENPLDS